MDFIARKFARSKWESDVIRADAVTGCLRTYRDTLSVWEADDTDISISEVALALASNMDRIDTFHIILISKQELQVNGLNLSSTPGNIPINDETLINRHQDIVSLDLSLLSAISHIFHSKVASDEGCYRISKQKIINLLCEAVCEGKLDLASLPERQEKLKQKIRKTIGC